MKSLKTYQTVNKQDSQLSFSIARMEDIYDSHAGVTDEPHRHDYYTILIIKEASGIHKIDFNAYPLAKNQIYFISPGQVHQVIEHQKSYGYAMTFSSDFLVESAIALSFVSDLKLFRNYGETPPLSAPDAILRKINYQADEIWDLYGTEEYYKYQSIGAYLKLLLIQCSIACSISPDLRDAKETKRNLIRDFKHAVDKNYTTEHSTRYYAQLLHVSPDHLSRTIKNSLGKTAKEYIQTRITIEAKRLLYFTDLTQKEIGYELGFNEPANFSAFFKKHTSISPSDFKKQELST